MRSDHSSKLSKRIVAALIIAAGSLAVFAYLSYTITAYDRHGESAIKFDLRPYVGAILIIGFFASPVIKGLKLRKDLKRSSAEAAAALLDGFSPLNALERSIAKVLSGGWWTDESFMMDFCVSRFIVVGELQEDRNHFALNILSGFEGSAPFLAFTHRARMRQADSDAPYKVMEMSGAELLVFTMKHSVEEGQRRGIILFIGKQALIDQRELKRMRAKLPHIEKKLLDLRKSLDEGLKTLNRVTFVRDRESILEVKSMPASVRIRIGIPALTPGYLPDIADRLRTSWPEVEFAYLFLREIGEDQKHSYVIGLDIPSTTIFGRVIADLSRFIKDNPEPYQAYVDFEPIRPFSMESEYCRLNVEPFYVNRIPDRVRMIQKGTR